MYIGPSVSGVFSGHVVSGSIIAQGQGLPHLLEDTWAFPTSF